MNRIARPCFFFCLGFCLPFLLCAQAEKLEALAESALQNGKPDSAVYYLGQAFSEFEAKEDGEGMTRTALRKGYALLSARSTEQAIEEYRLATALAEANELEMAYRKAGDALATTFFLTGRPAEAIPLLHRGIALAQQSGDLEHKATQLVQLGYAYFQIGRLDSVEALLREGLAIKETLRDTLGITLALNYLGLFYYQLGDYERAQDHYLQTLRRKEEIGDSAGIAIMKKNLSDLFMSMGDPSRAETYAREALTLATRLGLKVYRAEAMSNLALLNTRQGAFREALDQYQDILNFYRQSGNRSKTVQYLLRLGETHMDLKDLEKALEAVQEAMELATVINDRASRISSLLSYAELRLRQEEPELGLAPALEAAALAERSDMQPRLRQAARLLSALYQQLGNYPKALEWQQTYAALQDSLFRREKQETVYELETRYQLAGKQKQIDLLNTQNELKALQLDQARRRQVLLAGGLGLAVLSGLLIFLLLRHRQRIRLKDQQLQTSRLRERMIEMELKALRAQMNPHFVFNCLNSINLLVLQGELQPASRYLTRFSKLMRQVLEHSEQEFVTLEEEISLIRNYLNLEALRFKDKVSYRITVDEQIEPESLLFPPMVLQPLVENALWHGLMHKGTGGQLNIGFTEENGKLLCWVMDDGVGRKPAREPSVPEKRSSFGLHVVRERLSRINVSGSEPAHLKIIDLVDEETSVGQGTRVEIRIPLEALAGEESNATHLPPAP